MAGEGDSETPGDKWDVSQSSGINFSRPEGDVYGDFPDIDPVTATDPIDVEEQLRAGLEWGLSPAEAVRRVGMFRTHVFEKGVDGLARGLSDTEAQRLILYQDLTAINSKYLDEELGDGDLQRSLGLSDTVSERTIDAIRDRMGGKKYRFEAAAANVAEWAEDADIDASRIRDAPEPVAVADGVDPPELVKLTRTMKTTGYAPIQLDRLEPTYQKWELFKPFEVASHDSIHPNNTHDTLKQKPYYWDRNAPTSKALWNQVRDYSRGRFRLMFICAFEQFLDLLDRYGLVPDRPDLAVDLTGWPWFGTIDDEGTPREDRKQPAAVEGTKPGRNYSHSWQFATISLANVQVPMTFAARSVKRRNRRHYGDSRRKPRALARG